MNRALGLTTAQAFRSLCRCPAALFVAAGSAVLLSGAAGIHFRPRFGVGDFAELCYSTVLIAMTLFVLLEGSLLGGTPFHLGVVARRRARDRGWALDVGGAAGVGVFSLVAGFLALPVVLLLHSGTTSDLLRSAAPAGLLGILGGLSIVLFISILSEVAPRLVVLLAGVALLLFTLSPTLLDPALRPLVFPVSPRHLSTDETGGVLPARAWYLSGILHDGALLILWWVVSRVRRR